MMTNFLPSERSIHDAKFLLRVYGRPGGRLPMTWYPESFARSVAMNDMRMRPGASRRYPGRSYRFYSGEAVYEFGHGLSYSQYAYDFLSAPETIAISSGSGDFIAVDEELEAECAAALRFEVVVSVRELGDGREGSPVVLLYFSPPAGGGAPRKQLIGFERVHLKGSGGVGIARIAVDPCQQLSMADKSGRRIIRLGEHTLLVEGGRRRALFIV